MRLEVHPFKTIDEAREWARNEIDACAGKARARYITVAAGQEATYQAKYADAQAFVRAGYPEGQVEEYPWVRKEAEAIGGTPRAAADAIKAAGDPWNQEIGPRIEGLRIGGKAALPALDTIGAVVVHARHVQTELGAV